MPFTFPDIIGIGAGQNFPAVDLTNQSVKGIAYFDDLADAQANAKNYQKVTGFIAVTTTGDPKMYQFVGDTDDVWGNDAFWVLVKTTGVDGETQPITFVDRMDVTFSPFGKHDGTAAGDPARLDHSLIPDEFEVVPTSNTSAAIYDVYTANPAVVNPTSGNNTWSSNFTNANGPFSGLSASDALDSISFLGYVKLGYEHSVPTSVFSGFGETAQAKIEATNWTGSDTSIVEYLKNVPLKLRPKVFYLHMPTDAAVEEERYIGYNEATGDFGDTAWTDAANWTYLTVASEKAIEFRVKLSSDSLGTSETTIPRRACYPSLAGDVWMTYIGFNDYVADMLKKLKLMVKFNASLKAHLETLAANANSPFGESADDVSVCLKTKIVG